MIASLALLAAAVAAAFTRRRRRGPRLAVAVIVSPRRSTVIARDGKVRSVQSAKLTLGATELQRLWTPANLENLAHTYWRFLTRVTLGLIRVIYEQDGRRVVLLVRPLTLLHFDPPEYEIEPERGRVSWRIRDGLLVARSGRSSGWLSLDVRRLPIESDDGPDRRSIRIEVEVANFFPAIANFFPTPVYEMTQSAIHVLVTHAYLRSLASLHLDVSRIGTLARRAAETDIPRASDAPDAAAHTADQL